MPTRLAPQLPSLDMKWRGSSGRGMKYIAWAFRSLFLGGEGRRWGRVRSIVLPRLPGPRGVLSSEGSPHYGGVHR